MEKKTADKAKILIIDDDPVRLQLLKKAMVKNGKEVIAAMGGHEALQKLREVQSVDLIITDLYMPGIDGWKLCRLLRSLEFAQFNKIPILVMSATFSGSDAEEITRELGANGFLAVPYNPEELYATVDDLLSGRMGRKKTRVLVVDDDIQLRETIRDGFSDYGFLVCEASNAKEARLRFQEMNPEIVVLDYHLPDDNGSGLIGDLKSPQGHVAILAITGDTNPDLAVEITQKGADAFVHKPFKIQYLVDLCEKIRREWSLLRVETLLEDRTLELRRILETSVDGIMIFDSSDCIIQVNGAVEAMLGWRRDDLIGKHLWDLMPADEDRRREAREITVELKRRERISGIEQVWQRKNGRLFHVEVNFSLVRDIKSNATGSLACIRDITDRKRAEEELKRSEARYHSLVDNANDAVISTRSDGVITSFNKKAEQMFGYTREEMLGKPVTLLSPVCMREKQQKMFEEFSRTRQLYIVGKTMEGQGLRKSGEEFPLEGSSFIIEHEGEQILTVLIRDISERKKMEERLLQTEKLKSLGELASGVAHNFNNILAVILGRAQLLRRSIELPSGKEERRKFVYELNKSLEIIEKASFDGADTVRRIQEFSRKKNVVVAAMNMVDLNEVIEHTLEFTKMKWQQEAAAQGIKISIVRDLAPLAPVAGSASELREVFINIINNAIDALPRGGTISVRTRSEAGQVVAMVEDNGVGIPRDIQDKIFDPFFTTKGVQSTGLGMSVSYGIINRHHGTIAVESAENQGTLFRVMLPSHTGAVPEDKKEESLPERKRKASILVVEDEEDVRELLRDILIDGGHEVEFSANGEKGIELFQEKEFDLVFTDLGMPGMSGWQVAEKIKQINRQTPVALITGWEVKQKKQELKNKGVDLVLKKPFRVDEILRLVQEWMVEREDRVDAAR